MWRSLVFLSCGFTAFPSLYHGGKQPVPPCVLCLPFPGSQRTHTCMRTHFQLSSVYFKISKTWKLNIFRTECLCVSISNSICGSFENRLAFTEDCAMHNSKCFTCVILLNPPETLQEGGIIIILHFTGVKTRHKKVKRTAQNQRITQAKKSYRLWWNPALWPQSTIRNLLWRSESD